MPHVGPDRRGRPCGSEEPPSGDTDIMRWWTKPWSRSCVNRSRRPLRTSYPVASMETLEALPLVGRDVDLIPGPE